MLIHGKTHFGRRLFCNGVVPLTPEKVEDSGCPDQTSMNPSSPSVKPSCEQPTPGSAEELPPEFRVSESSNHENFTCGSSTGVYHESSTSQLVRRHSLSLLDRSPPPNSLAAELLASSKLTRISSKAIMSDIADIRGSLSDFTSCIESTEDDSSHSNDDGDNLKQKDIVSPLTMNEKNARKRGKESQLKHLEKKIF